MTSVRLAATPALGKFTTVAAALEFTICLMEPARRSVQRATLVMRICANHVTLPARGVLGLETTSVLFVEAATTTKSL